MENFLTWDVLLTYGGCVAGTILVTEFLKKLFPKIVAQLVSFAVAVLILVCGHLAVGDFNTTEVLLYVINAMGISLASNGGFDALKGIFGKKETAPNDIVVGEPDENGDQEVYLQFDQSPADLKEGDVISFQVKKASQK